MTAAVLQFNQHIKQTQSNSQSDYIDTPMTKEYHQIMIDLLNTEHPFRAVKLAAEFNRENGFELIDAGIIRKWKRELKNQKAFSINQNENSQIKIARLKSDFSGIEVEKFQDSEIKKLKYENAFKELLKTKL